MRQSIELGLLYNGAIYRATYRAINRAIYRATILILNIHTSYSGLNIQYIYELTLKKISVQTIFFFRRFFMNKRIQRKRIKGWRMTENAAFALLLQPL